MNNLSINPQQSFTGTYRVNVNQLNKKGYPSVDRDLMLGVWMTEAKNGNEIHSKIEKFFTNEYNKDETAPCFVNYVIADKDDSRFEEDMKECGQKFTKLA